MTPHDIGGWAVSYEPLNEVLTISGPDQTILILVPQFDATRAASAAQDVHKVAALYGGEETMSITSYPLRVTSSPIFDTNFPSIIITDLAVTRAQHGEIIQARIVIGGLLVLSIPTAFADRLEAILRGIIPPGVLPRTGTRGADP